MAKSLYIHIYIYTIYYSLNFLHGIGYLYILRIIPEVVLQYKETETGRYLKWQQRHTRDINRQEQLRFALWSLTFDLPKIRTETLSDGFPKIPSNPSQTTTPRQKYEPESYIWSTGDCRMLNVAIKAVMWTVFGPKYAQIFFFSRT